MTLIDKADRNGFDIVVSRIKLYIPLTTVFIISSIAVLTFLIESGGQTICLDGILCRMSGCNVSLW